LSGAHVVREPEGIIAIRGRPFLVVSDHGTDLTSMAILGGGDQRHDVHWHDIALGKP
jgi:putative transposase